MPDFVIKMQEAIKKFLPENLWAIAFEYTIPVEFVEQMPELIVLVLQSKSMDKAEEKQSWFNLLPLMNEEQIAKLNDILTKERDKLAEIEKRYEEKKVEIKKKYLMRRQTMGSTKKVDDIQTKAAAAQAQYAQEADAMLAGI